MGAELTPAQHARIRRQIALIPVYVWLIYAWSMMFVHLPVSVPGFEPRALRDFATFYVQGVIARDHRTSALYDIDAQGAILREVVPGQPTALYPPVHGPQVALLFRPLAALSYTQALWVWLGLTVVVYAICGIAISRVCERLRDRRWETAVLLAGAPAFHYTLNFGQTTLLALGLFTAAYSALRHDRRFLAGLAIGSLAYKPQLGLAAGLVFVCCGEWRIVAGAAIAAVVQFAVGGWYWGPHIFVDYANALLRLPEVAPGMEITYQMHSWRSFFMLLRLPPALAMTAYIVLAAATAAIAVRCWRSNESLDLRYAVLMIATVLINPHMYVYDLIILMPAFLLVWNWALSPLMPSRLSKSLLALLYFCFFSPLFAIAATVMGLQLSVLGFSVVFVLIASTLLGRTTAAHRFPAFT